MHEHIAPYSDLQVLKCKSPAQQRDAILFDLENVVHELAHLLSQGVTIPEFPSMHSLPVLQCLQHPYRVSRVVSNALELDANAITLLVGGKLGLWSPRRLHDATHVYGFNLEGFAGDPKEAILSQMKDPYIKGLARALIQYLVV
jgi:hypothetical protein